MKIITKQSQSLQEKFKFTVWFLKALRHSNTYHRKNCQTSDRNFVLETIFLVKIISVGCSLPFKTLFQQL